MNTELKLILIAMLVSVVVACPLIYLAGGGLQILGILIFAATMVATPIMRFIPKSPG